MKDNNKYTRWRTTDNEEEEEEEDEEGGENSLEEPLDGPGENYDQMQEGRRVLGMAPPPKSQDTVLTPAAVVRLISISVLVCLFCVLVGALIGYLASSKSHFSNMVCPTPATSENCTNGGTTASPPSTTTTTPSRRTTTTSKAPTTSVIPKPPRQEDIGSLSKVLLSHLTPDLIRRYVENITSIRADKLKNIVRSTFHDLGYSVESRVFPVMMSLTHDAAPNTVEMIMKDGSAKIINNSTSSLKDLYPFSGFSPNGTVSSVVTYGHFGRTEDFALLKKNRLTINGTIVLIRAGDLHPGIQVMNAEREGAVGVILYPDPQDHGGIGSNGKVYPSGTALPLDGVIWQSLRYTPGDPSTPYYSSQKYSYRIPPEEYTGVPHIVVQPVSSETGKMILSNLEGPLAPKRWNGALLEQYRLGGSFKANGTVNEIRLTSHNFIAEESSTNIHATVKARDISKVIHIGCSYESKGGTLTSSGLGLASLLALADALRKTLTNGTERQVVFSVFEALDGDSSGVTEYSQLYTSWLETAGLAYIDMDSVIEGSGYLKAHVSPLLREVVRDAFTRVPWPADNTLDVMQGMLKTIPAERILYNKSDSPLRDSFEFQIPFECDGARNYQLIHGIPVVQLVGVSVNKNESYKLTLKNSQYDTVDSLIQLTDRNLTWTHMVASVLGVMTLALSAIPLPPVKFDEVGYDLKREWNQFIKDSRVYFAPTSTVLLQDILDSVTSEMDVLILTLESFDLWYKEKQDSDTWQSVRAVDDRVMQWIQFSRRFLKPRAASQHSLFGSHLAYGPNPKNPCEGTYFPGVKKVLLDALSGTGSWSMVKEELSYLQEILAAFNTDIVTRSLGDS